MGPPRRVAVLTALGEPIECPKTEKPSREMVDEYHAKVCVLIIRIVIMQSSCSHHAVIMHSS